MKKFLKQVFAAALCCTMLAGFVRPVQSHAATDYESLRAVFDPEYYYNQYPDIQASVGQDAETLFQHFVSTGIREGRSGKEDFNLKAYVFYNEDLLNVYKTDLSGYCRHYLERGRNEGRISTYPENRTNKIGTYHTSYDAAIPRAVNVELAAQRINGVVLQPGQGFSFSSTVQSRVPKNGYVLAPAIGGYEYGGGICQVSSTLYAAMCHALLPATERHPHSSRVSYLPVGMDATISEGSKDLRFTNIYSSPLIIECTYGDGVLTVSLWLGEIQEETTQEIPAEQTEEQPSQEPNEQEPGQESLNQEGPGQQGPGQSEPTQEEISQQEPDQSEPTQEEISQQEPDQSEPTQEEISQKESDQNVPNQEEQNQGESGQETDQGEPNQQEPTQVQPDQETQQSDENGQNNDAGQNQQMGPGVTDSQETAV